MGYDKAKVEAQSKAAEMLRMQGLDARLEDSMAGIWIEVRRSPQRLYLFLDGAWDAKGEAAEGDFLALAQRFGNIDDGDLEDETGVDTTGAGPVDWADPESISSAIRATITGYEGR